MIRLQLLGKLEVTDSSGTSVRSVVTQSRRVALLAYLAAAEPHGFHRRDKLLALLWPEYEEARARAALRKALHFLRHELGPVIVNRGDQEIGIDPDQLQCDARELVERLEEGDWENALPLYQGDLLDGFFISEAPEFHNWLDEARTQLRQRAIRAALQLADARAKRRESSAAKSWSGWATSRAPYDEGVLRHRLEILAVLGDRAGALKIYQEFADRLLSDLEVEPSPETEAYVEHLRQGTFLSAETIDDATPAEVTPSGHPPAAPKAQPRPQSARLPGGHALLVGAAAVAAIAVLTVAWLVATRGQNGAPRGIPEPRQVTFDGDILEATLSGDGRFVAYITQRRSQHVLNVLEIGVAAPIELWSVDPLLVAPSWSPDGMRLLVRTMDGTYMLPRSGAAAPQLMNAWNVAAWTPDGSRIYSWWPQAQHIRITDVATNDTVSVALPTDHDWLEGASWSPADDRIAFITAAGTGAYSLFLMALDGSGLQLVHQDSVNLFSPQWSPTGDAIYYLRHGPSDELWKVPVASDGTRRHPPARLLSGLSFQVRNQAIPTFAISQDGRRLLYTRRSGFANLWLFQTDTSDGTPRQVTRGTSAVRTPRFSPANQRIVFADSVAGRSRLFITPTEGGPVRELAFAEDFARDPTWSPDGNRIAYGTMRMGRGLVRTLAVDAGLHSDVELEEVAGGDWLAWAPNTGLMYLHATDRNYGVVDPETGEERSLLTDSPGWMYEPRASSDGRLLAVYTDLPGNAPSGIWIIDVAHGDAVPLHEEMVPIGWSANDSTVYAMRETDRREGGSREIFAISSSGGEPVLFFTLPLNAEPWNVDVAQDGSLIVAALNEFQTDAWIIDNFDPERSGGG